MEGRIEVDPCRRILSVICAIAKSDCMALNPPTDKESESHRGNFELSVKPMDASQRISFVMSPESSLTGELRCRVENSFDSIEELRGSWDDALVVVALFLYVFPDFRRKLQESVRPSWRPFLNWSGGPA